MLPLQRERGKLLPRRMHRRKWRPVPSRVLLRRWCRPAPPVQYSGNVLWDGGCDIVSLWDWAIRVNDATNQRKLQRGMYLHDRILLPEWFAPADELRRMSRWVDMWRGWRASRDPHADPVVL